MSNNFDLDLSEQQLTLPVVDIINTYRLLEELSDMHARIVRNLCISYEISYEEPRNTHLFDQLHKNIDLLLDVLAADQRFDNEELQKTRNYDLSMAVVQVMEEKTKLQAYTQLQRQMYEMISAVAEKLEWDIDLSDYDSYGDAIDGYLFNKYNKHVYDESFKDLDLKFPAITATIKPDIEDPNELMTNGVNAMMGYREIKNFDIQLLGVDKYYWLLSNFDKMQSFSEDTTDVDFDLEKGDFYALKNLYITPLITMYRFCQLYFAAGLLRPDDLSMPAFSRQRLSVVTDDNPSENEE